MDAVLAGATIAHVLGWSVYVGGALGMELIWRPAQQDIPPSQVAVTCQRMGRRYRWIALSSLAVIGVSGAVRLARLEYVSLWPIRLQGPLVLFSGYGRLMLAGVASWLLLVGIVTTMSFAAHPALHVRTSPEMSPENRAAARARVAKAIKRMNLLLRLELVVALVAALIGAGLRVSAG